MKDYGSSKEKSHIKHLRKLGFHVINPADEYFQDKVEQMRKEGKTSSQIMDWFVEYVEQNCDHLAFAMTDKGKVSAGVWREIEAMRNKGGFVIQMPDFDKMKVMTIEQTRRYIE
jgi:hypothetical protein